MRTTLIVLTLGAMSLVPGCRARIPEGVFTCMDDSECPPGQRCVDRLCVTGPRPDGGGLDVAPEDAPPIDANGATVVVRVVHAAPGRPMVALEEMGTPLTSAVGFGATSATATVAAGTRMIRLTGPSVVVNETVTLEPGQSYALVFWADGTADRILAVPDPTSGSVVVNVMAATIEADLDGSFQTLGRPSMNPLVAAPGRLRVRAVGDLDVVAVFDGSMWPDGSIAILSGRTTGHPLAEAGPHVVLGSPSEEAQDGLPLTWLVAPSSRDVSLCDLGTAIATAARGTSVGPLWDVPDAVLLALGTDCSGSLLPLPLPSGPRRVVTGAMTTLGAVALGLSEPASAAAAFRYVFYNGTDEDVTVTGLDVVSPVAPGSTVSADPSSAITRITFAGGLFSSMEFDVPPGDVAFMALEGRAVVGFGYVAAGLVPGTPLVVVRSSW